jgi:ATP phosphoribosyltransferase regulatory subunit
MERFGKKMGAVGFAVYLDKLERFGSASDDFDVDYMLLYSADVPAAKIIAAANELSADGSSVRASSAIDAGVRYRKLVRLSKGGLQTLEAND